MSPLVSVIVINYNGKRYLEKCFSSLIENSFKDFELIFVDNGSTDGSLDLMRKRFPEVKVIALKENLGLAIASNKGRRLAEGKYLFFFNNDTIADRDLLAELINAAESDPTIGVCGCKTVTYHGGKEINCGIEMDIFGYPYGKGRPFYVDAGIFIRKDIFDEIGWFDEKMFLYCEDRDLCWRVWLYGYKVVAVPTAIFKHDSFCLVEGDKFSTNLKQRFMNETFTIRMLLKNYSFLTLLNILPRYFLINLTEMMLFTIRGKIRVVLGAYLKAYLWNVVNLGDTLRQRQIIQRARRVDDRAIQCRMEKRSGKLTLFKKVGIPEFKS